MLLFFAQPIFPTLQRRNQIVSGLGENVSLCEDRVRDVSVHELHSITYALGSRGSDVTTKSTVVVGRGAEEPAVDAVLRPGAAVLWLLVALDLTSNWC